MDKRDVLSRCSLFKNLDDRQLAMINEECHLEIFEPGEIMAKQDINEDKLYIIKDGLVLITLEISPWSEHHVQYASNFEIVGWSAMLVTYTDTTTVKAIEETRALAFDGKRLHTLCLSHPDIGCHVYQGLSHVLSTRLQRAYHQLVGVTSQI